jgi:hypothetical protein
MRKSPRECAATIGDALGQDRMHMVRNRGDALRLLNVKIKAERVNGNVDDDASLSLKLKCTIRMLMTIGDASLSVKASI